MNEPINVGVKVIVPVWLLNVIVPEPTGMGFNAE
jgi:hypothetical protein